MSSINCLFTIYQSSSLSHYDCCCPARQVTHASRFMAGASAIDSGVDVMTDELGAQCLICWETCESGSRDCSGCKRSICLECLRRYVVSRVSMVSSRLYLVSGRHGRRINFANRRILCIIVIMTNNCISFSFPSTAGAAS